MNKDWEKIDQLFHQALECPNESRTEFLANAAQQDPALGSKLQALLDANENNHSFMESPVMRVSLSPQFGLWQTQIAEALVPPSGNQITGQMIGRLLDGKYRLEELCGRGGMGAVYRATHVGTGRRVAVKVIAPELAGNREFIERFRREAKTIGRLRHPNIVNVTDFGITGENEQTLAYLVMEHLEGVTLAVKLKDKRPLPLAIAAITLWKQNSVTAACTLFLEQTRKPGKTEVETGAIVKAIRRRSGALARATWAELYSLARKLCSFKLSEIRRWSDSLLIIPPLLKEGLSVDEAGRRSAKLIEPLRRKLAYPFFRRLLAFALVLTVWQAMVVIWGVTLDGGRRGLTEVIIIWLLSALAYCFIAFGLSLKSSIEQAVLYGAARQALGEGAAETDGPPYRQDMEARPRGLWLSFRTYAPTCALLLLIGAVQFQKFPLMVSAISSREIHTVKALQATGVPLPFWSPADRPTSIRRWLNRADMYQPHIFSPFGPSIIQSQAITKFLIEKGFDVNTRLVFKASWALPGVGGSVTMTPLHVALTDGRVETARLLIAHGADVHARDSFGRPPLIVAITHCPSAIEPLLVSGVDINEQTRFGPPLLAAARYQWLYHRWRRMRQRENAVKILLEKGADPNTRDSDGRNALMVMSMEPRSIGARLGVLGVRQRWRSIPPPPPRPGLADSPVVTVSRGAPHDPLDINVETEPDRDLLLIGDALIQAKCDVNAADSSGRTPLMYAARYSRLTAVRVLVEAGANVNARDKGGMTALDLANQFANREIIGLLQRAGAIPGAPKKPGAGPVKPAA